MIRSLFIAILLCCTAFGSDPIKQSKDGTVFYGSLQSVDLRIELTTPTIYLLKDDAQAIVFRLSTINLKHAGKLAEYVGGVFKVGESAVELKVESESESLKITRNGEIGTQYVFTKEGNEHIIVKIEGDALRIPVLVKRLELRSGDPAKLLIDKYGFPTNRKKIWVSWPDLETHDDIVYHPQAGSSESAEHWKFEKLPNAIFVIRNEKVARVHSFGREWSLLDVAKDDWFPDEVSMETKDSKDEKEAVEGFPTWTAVDGTTLTGKFKTMLKGEVVLEKPDGKRVRINISKFKDADAAKLRELNKAATKSKSAKSGN